MITANPTLCGVIQLWVCFHLIVVCLHFKSARSIVPVDSESWTHWETMIVVADLFKCRLNTQLPKVERADLPVVTIKLNLGCWTYTKCTHKHALLLGHHLHLWNQYNTHSWALLSHCICSGADKDRSYNEREPLRADTLLLYLHSDLPDLESPIINGFLRAMRRFHWEA